jgi:hypothetical protein
MTQNQRQHHVLMIAFHYPPDNTSTGVLRTLKFTKYLVEHHWVSDVITVDKNLYYSVDDNQMATIPPSTNVFPCKAFDAKKVFSIKGVYPSFIAVPDRYWSWIVTGYKKAKTVIKANKDEVVYSTYPVPSALLIGLLIKTKLKLPWVVDFRDPWVEDSMPVVRRKFEGYLEKKVLQKADLVICNTNRMKAWFHQRYPNIEQDKFVTIPNGYDESDLQDIVPEPSEKFEILYTGIIGPHNRNPLPLLQAVRYSLDNKWLDESDLKITFLGAGAYGHSKQFDTQISELKLENVVNIIEKRIPYKQALNKTAGADVVIVLSEPLGDDRKSEAERQWSHLQVPAKVYECMGIGSQILALVSSGAVADIIEETNLGLYRSPKDIEGIALCLKSYYENKSNVKPQKNLSNKVADYSRKRLSGVLAKNLENLVDKYTDLNQTP